MTLDHLNLVVADLPRQVAFYRDVCGCRPVLERELSGPWVDQLLGVAGAVMECVILQPPGGGPRLELLAYRRPEPVTATGTELPQTLGLRHFAFAVADLDAAVARLTAAGVVFLSAPVEVPFAVGGRRKRLVYCLDPEGVLLELAEYQELQEPTMTLRVPDLMCDGCAATIRRAVQAVPGVETIEIDVAARRVVVTGGDETAVIRAIAAAGYAPEREE